MFSKVLIANRGAIACRILRTLRQAGHRLGRGVLRSRCARAACAAGRRGVLPRPRAGGRELSAAGAHPRHRAAMRRRGDPSGIRIPLRERGLRGGLRSRRHRLHRPDARADARLRTQAHGARAGAKPAACRCCRAAALLPDLAAALAAAERIGYPVMLKSTAGGGGIGMQPLRLAAATSRESFDSRAAPRRRTTSAMRGVFLEKFVASARHIEVQLFGDGRGDGHRARRTRLLGAAAQPEGDRGIPRARTRRRHRATNCTPPRCASARRCSYRSAGTVEFVYDADAARVLFPRSEHAAAGRAWRHRGSGRHRSRGVDDPRRRRRAAGSAAHTGMCRGATPIQARVYAEDPARGFRPSSGLLTAGRCCRRTAARRCLDRDRHRGDRLLRSDAREDHRARRDARRRDRAARRGACGARASHGIETNLPYLRVGARASACSPRASRPPRLLDTLSPSAARRRSADGRHDDHRAGLAGTHGLWDVGVPPSGPMDALRVPARQSHGRQSREGARRSR